MIDYQPMSTLVVFEANETEKTVEILLGGPESIDGVKQETNPDPNPDTT